MQQLEQAPCCLPQESLTQLGFLDRSQKLIVLIGISLVLQYYVISVQKKQVIEAVCCPEALQECPVDTISIRLGASLLVLGALFGFWQLGEESRRQAALAGEEIDTLEPVLSAIVILVALLRFFRLLKPDTAAQDSWQTQSDTQQQTSAANSQ